MKRPRERTCCVRDERQSFGVRLDRCEPRCWLRRSARTCAAASGPAAKSPNACRSASVSTQRPGHQALCYGCMRPVSGETTSILPVLDALRHRVKVLLTTGTVTSQALLNQRIPEHGLTGDVLHRFAPLDVPSWVGRFLSHWQPDAACFVESELWPNQLAACQARGIKLMLLNARMSDRSFAPLAPRAGVRAPCPEWLFPYPGPRRPGCRTAAGARCASMSTALGT